MTNLDLIKQGCDILAKTHDEIIKQYLKTLILKLVEEI